MLRVNAILRRTQKNTGPADADNHVIFSKEGLTADLTAYRVFIDGVEAHLAPKEYDLLFFLIRNKNIAIPRGEIAGRGMGL